MQRGSIYNVSVKWIFWGGLFFGVARKRGEGMQRVYCTAGGDCSWFEC